MTTQISFCADLHDHLTGAAARHIAFYTTSRAAARRWAARNLPCSSIARAPYVLIDGRRMTVAEFLGA